MANKQFEIPQSNQKILPVRNQNDSQEGYMHQHRQNNHQIKSQQNQQKQESEISNKLNQQKYSIFGFTLLFSQIVICIIHGIFIRPDKQINPSYQIFPSTSFFIPFVLSILSTLGLGLLFSYHKKLIFSGLGYSFFINAYMLQYYPLINALWSKTKVFITQQQDFDKLQAFYLTHQSSFSNIKNFSYNHIEGCFRCAMAINVAVSCILGRCGLFQVFVTILIGGFGYELNLRICTQNFGDDVFGSLYIFAFGGFMGLAMGIMLRFRDRQDKFTAKNKNFCHSSFSGALSLFGCAILIISMPFLAFEPHTNVLNEYQHYSPTLCIMLSTSSGFMGGLSIALITGQPLKIRDFMHGPIAGAIMGGVVSFFTTNLAFCLGVGLFAGSIQVAAQYMFQRKIARRHRPFTTISFFLFGLQGFLASIAGVIGKTIVDNASPNMDYVSVNYATVKLFLYGLVSSAMGFGFGLIIGLICYLVHVSQKRAYFNDQFDWIIDDGTDNIQRNSQKIKNSLRFIPRPLSGESFETIKPNTVVSIPY